MQLNIVYDANGNPLDKSNVFYDTYYEVIEYYKENITQIWEKSLTVCMADTSGDVGLFPKSDIIVIFSNRDFKPIIVTERIYRKNYTAWDWRRIKAVLKRNVRVLRHDLGFNLSISVSRDYLDYVHYKEDWWSLCINKKTGGVKK